VLQVNQRCSLVAKRSMARRRGPSIKTCYRCGRAVNFGPWAVGRAAILTLSSPAINAATDNGRRERQEQFSV
jgi:hypothetical protein